MQRDKPKTAIAEMLKQVKSAASSHDGSEIQVLEKISNFPYHDVTQKQAGIIIKIDSSECVLWKFKDRIPSDLGDINSLAEDIKLNGQTQPGVVRILKNNEDKKKYEIIVGERRWRACDKAGISFTAIVSNVGDQEAAIIQASENLQRKDLSDYAKGMNYATLINNQVITQVELQKKLNLSKATISALLSFAAIPSEIIEAIGDLSKVSANVASLIRAHSNKGEKYVKALIKIAPNIRSGIGGQYFKKLIEDAFSSKTSEKNETLVIKDNNEEFFSLKMKNSEVTGISLFKRIISKDKLVDFLLSIIREDNKK
jgi:ParB family chromosome partitioning protein